MFKLHINLGTKRGNSRKIFDGKALKTFTLLTISLNKSFLKDNLFLLRHSETYSFFG